MKCPNKTLNHIVNLCPKQLLQSVCIKFHQNIYVQSSVKENKFLMSSWSLQPITLMYKARLKKTNS